VRLTFCGVRGSTPAPGPEFVRYGGHTSCVAVAHDGAAAPTLILDAGTGVRRVSTLLADQPFTGTILLTHLHWDHVQGLPFFRAGDRDDATVTLLLPDQRDGTGAEEVLARAMSPPPLPDPSARAARTLDVRHHRTGPARGRRVHRAGVRDPAQGRPDARVPGQ
jgi:phosphoribosyl 1,2-cyclic phosphodiesterase